MGELPGLQSRDLSLQQRAIDGRPWTAALQRERKSGVLRLRSGRELKADMGDESVATIGGAPSNDCSHARRVAATDGLTAIDPGYEGAVVGGETDRDRREVHNRRVSAGACFRSS